MTALQPVRGTRDLIGEEFRRHHAVGEAARHVSALYGFEEWATPVFEDTRVFARGLGDSSDVVMKEMYTFEDRGGDSVTLRPEMTAGVCRALVSNGLTQSNLPRKVFYAGPMFRYERPQKGRYRQFHQIGIEVLGAAEPLADAEVIACGWDILVALGVSDGTVLEINTLGDTESRDAYRAALVAYFSAHREALSQDSQVRLEKNPLRILDSKDEGDRAIVAGAPLIGDHLSQAAADFYAAVKGYLVRFGVPFRENPRIVRGLDYYSHTAFEFVTDRLGAQGTVMAGGRYNGLVEEMGGPPTPAVGWAAGMERLAMLLPEAPEAPRAVAVIPAGEGAEGPAIEVLRELREAGVAAEIGYRGNLKRRMERANKSGAFAAVILGEAEIAEGSVVVRDLLEGTQNKVPRDQLLRALAETTGGLDAMEDVIAEMMAAQMLDDTEETP
jgi:histidyl-tRNA synthetase